MNSVSVKYPDRIDFTDSESRSNHDTTELSLDTLSKIARNLERRVGTLDSDGDADNHELRIAANEAATSGLSAPSPGTDWFNPNTTQHPYESKRSVEIVQGVTIAPPSDNGYGNLNILYRVHNGQLGSSGLEWAELIDSGPNAGKYIKRYTIANDIAQPLVQSAIGDLINPLFILFNFTDPDLADGTSYDYIFIQTYFQNLGGGGNDRYAGQMGIGTVINASSIYTLGSFPGIPSSYCLLDLHFDDSTMTRPFLRMTYSASGYTRFDIAHNGSMRWYGHSSTHDPNAGQGYAFTFAGAGANDNNDLELRGGAFALYTTEQISMASLGVDLTFNLVAATGTDKGVYQWMQPTGTANSFILASTNSLYLGAFAAGSVVLRTSNIDRLTIDATGIATLAGETRVSGIFKISDGTAAAPSLTFTSSTGAGLSFVAGGGVSISSAGAAVITAKNGKLGAGTTDPQYLTDLRQTFVDDTRLTYLVAGYGGDANNRSITIQQICNTTGNHYRQFIFLNGNLGSTSTAATPTGTSSYTLTLGLEATNDTLSLIVAPVGANQTIIRALSFSGSANIVTYDKIGLGTGSQNLQGDGGMTPRLYVSNPSNAAQWLAGGYDNNGQYGFIYAVHTGTGWKPLVLGGDANVGVGTGGTVSAKLHVINTTEQQRVGYDASNYYKVTVGSTGTVTLDAVGSGAKFVFSDPIEIGNAINVVSPTAPDRTITIVVGGTTLYVTAKTTND